MQFKFKKIFLSIVFVSIFFNTALPFEQIAKTAYKTTSYAKFPAGLAVLYTHAKSNENLEIKTKLIEALIQMTNELSFHAGYRNDVGYLDNAWLGFETFRFIKYLRKYLDLKKKKILLPLDELGVQGDQEKENNSDENNSNQRKDDSVSFAQLMYDFNLTEQEVEELFGDELSPVVQDLIENYDDEKNVFDLENEKSDKNKSKGIAFKIKIFICFFLTLLETVQSLKFVTTAENMRFDNRNTSLFYRGLRYFLLSETGSLEVKVAITMSLLSFLKSVSIAMKIILENKRARYNYSQYRNFNFQGDRNGEGYNYSGNNYQDYFDQMFEEEMQHTKDVKEAREMFGLGGSFSREDLNKAYKKLQREWHPDRSQHPLDEATEMSKKINHYKEILQKLANG